MPAEGPSLGIAPAGTWTWTSIEPSRSSGIQGRGAWRRVGQRGARRLLHHVAELAGEDQRTLPQPASSRRSSAGARPPRSRRTAASTNMMSPPAGRVVHARGHADLVRLAARSGWTRGRPAARARRRRRSSGRSPRPAAQLARDLARHRADLPLELTHAALAGVLAARRHHGVVGERDDLSDEARSPRAGAGSGTSWRSRPSPARCSRRTPPPPSGPSAGPGCSG